MPIAVLDGTSIPKEFNDGSEANGYSCSNDMNAGPYGGGGGRNAQKTAAKAES